MAKNLRLERYLQRMEYPCDLQQVQEFMADLGHNSKYQCMRAIVWYYMRDGKEVPAEITELKKSLETASRQADSYRYPTEREIQNYVSIDEVKARLEEFLARQEKDLDDRIATIILALYALLPPLRGGEYIKCGFMADGVATGYPNQYDADAREFIIKSHKTVHLYGEKRVPVSDELHRIIVENRADQTDHLFGTPANDSLIRDTLSRIFGRRIGSTGLRNSFISETALTTDLDTRREIAAIMGHSVGTQDAVYRKFEYENTRKKLI